MRGGNCGSRGLLSSADTFQTSYVVQQYAF